MSGLIWYALVALVVWLGWRLLVPAWLRSVICFPITAAWLRLGWPRLADACGLADKKKRRTRDGVVLHPAPPGMRRLRPSRYGWTGLLRLRPGQTPAEVSKAAERLAHAWRIHAVRVEPWAPGVVRLYVTRRNPLRQVTAPVVDPGELLRVPIGRLDTGAPWIVDLRITPHLLDAGATGSGKSTFLNAVVVGLAPQLVALVGFDLKGGMEFTPYAPRMSALAMSRGECVQILRDLVAMLAMRMDLCKLAAARDIWALPDDVRPVPVVVLVDEVAELFLMATKDEKSEVSETATQMLRVAQLGRAVGVHLLVAGQRIGSDLGPGVTALRSQLSGRVCHRVNDPETAAMTLGDLDPAALAAARSIPPDTPGVAVVATDSGGWCLARSAYVSPEQAEQAAREWAHLAPAWADLVPAPDRLLAELIPAPRTEES